MRRLIILSLYMAVVFSANAALADMTELAELRDGDMKKLNFHREPVTVSDAPFILENGEEARLSNYRGEYVLLNFWATWCAPCRKEMPTLAALQAEFGGPEFRVLTLATGRNKPEGIERFFRDEGIDNLPMHRDPKQKVARDMAVLGLPVTVILDRDGQELARLVGDADWYSESARSIFRVLLTGN